jgi:hypothetical protein
LLRFPNNGFQPVNQYAVRISRLLFFERPTSKTVCPFARRTVVGKRHHRHLSVISFFLAGGTTSQGKSDRFAFESNLRWVLQTEIVSAPNAVGSLRLPLPASSIFVCNISFRRVTHNPGQGHFFLFRNLFERLVEIRRKADRRTHQRCSFVFHAFSLDLFPIGGNAAFSLHHFTSRR